MEKGKVILAKQKFNLTLDRLCQQLIENYGDFSDTCIVGIQEKGALFSDRLITHLEAFGQVPKLKYGKLDITFFRDDFRRGRSLTPSKNEMDFIVEGKKVILLDDVLYTGRTIQSAMNALQQLGRPDSVELMVFVDRRFNRHLPIQPNYVGITVDALNEAYVRVYWSEHSDKDEILFFDDK
ncbi:MAG: bifunctional pyr operon transcriptional regulator/uracil phosphoribosyltransferase PyrR [Saprospiraceae bacterium]|nr:bifunctional pyr operon transcriptional regulator/uracil phosphoribosyltransferase PyrR [Saprospiraceae bacterium]|tara:strand:- start:1447 stop:1989 length:543 start_codon:yes stop_codon:yes gene_type:complete